MEEQLVSGVAGDDCLTYPLSPLVPGSDYTTVDSTQLLSSTNTRPCVNIAIATDNIVENDETFTVQLSSTYDGVTFGVSMAIVTILDDDNSK